MSTVMWILQGLLAFAFLGAGATKLMNDSEELAGMGMDYAEDFSDAQINAIGAVEVLGAVGIIVPSAVGVVPILSGVAAAGLTLTMVGGSITHIRRGEYPMISVNLVLGAMAAYVAVHLLL